MTDQLYMTMNDGHNIPVVGLGTWKSEPGDSTYNAVFDSIKAGYRHIDTARAYDNESDVGRAIKAAVVPRENLFITTKLWNKDQGYDTALEACEKSLARLDCGYIDLYLIHWPLKDLRNDSWKAFIELQKRGLCRSIGVSNFTIDNLKELEELDFFENLNNNITFIEWPEILINLPLNKKHYLINLDMISETKRKINICSK